MKLMQNTFDTLRIAYESALFIQGWSNYDNNVSKTGKQLENVFPCLVCHKN